MYVPNLAITFSTYESDCVFVMNSLVRVRTVPSFDRLYLAGEICYPTGNKWKGPPNSWDSNLRLKTFMAPGRSLYGCIKADPRRLQPSLS